MTFDYRLTTTRVIAWAALVTLLAFPAGYAAAQASSPAVNKFTTDANALSATLTSLSQTAQTLDTDLVYVQGKLALPGKIASDLKQLNTALTTAKTLLQAVSAVPDIQQEAQLMLDGIDSTQGPVQDAQSAATDFDNGIKPVSDPVNALESTAHTLVSDIQKFQQNLSDYIKGVGNVQQCIDGLPGDIRSLPQTDLDKVANTSDSKIADLNTALSAILAQVTTLKTDVESRLHPLFDPVNEIEAAIGVLATSFDDMEGPLKDVGNIMNKSFSVTFPYPDPSKTNWFRWGHYKLRISMSTIAKGAASIEAEVERILSGFLYKFAKVFGLEKLIKTLMDDASKELNAALTKLHLNFSVKIPGLDDFKAKLDSISTTVQGMAPSMTLNVSPLDQHFATLQTDFTSLKQFALVCAPRPAPDPYTPRFPSGPGGGIGPRLPPGPIWPSSPQGGGPLGNYPGSFVR